MIINALFLCLNFYALNLERRVFTNDTLDEYKRDYFITPDYCVPSPKNSHYLVISAGGGMVNNPSSELYRWAN
jgi:hypothetical protein